MAFTFFCGFFNVNFILLLKESINVFFFYRKCCLTDMSVSSMAIETENILNYFDFNGQQKLAILK